MSENRKKQGGQSRSSKESKSLKFKGHRDTSEFRIGSRDILATPEILSPFDYEEEAPKTRRGRRNELNPAEEKPAAPTHNRKGKKKAEEPAPVKQETKASRAKADKPASRKADKKVSEIPVEVTPPQEGSLQEPPRRCLYRLG